MVECGGLENRLPFRGYEGSNPSSSAIGKTDPQPWGSFHVRRWCAGFEPRGRNRPVACCGVRSEATNPLSVAEGGAGAPSSPPDCTAPLPRGVFHVRTRRTGSNRKVAARERRGVSAIELTSAAAKVSAFGTLNVIEQNRKSVNTHHIPSRSCVPC